MVAGARSVAIILSRTTGKQKAYMVGDVIQYGVSVHSIGVSFVVVDNNGSLEKLLLHQRAVPSLKAIHAKTTIPVAVAQPAFSKKQRMITRSYIQEQKSNITKLLTQALVTPHYTDGDQDGFMINNIVNGSFYQKIGLKNSDVLRKVNGRVLTGVTQGVLMYRELSNANAIDLEIMRGGQIIPVHYKLNE